MSERADAFTQAWWQFRQHVWVFLFASGLLEAPVAVLQMLGGTRAIDPGGSSGLSSIVEFSVAVVSSGAVALLAINLRAGGGWGWREAWARAVARVRPLVTSHFAVALACIAVSVPFVLVASVIGNGRPGFFRTGSPLLALQIGGCVLLVLTRPILSIVTFVAVVEGIGWLQALSAAVRMCPPRSRQAWPLVLASALYQVPVFIIGIGGPEGRAGLAANALTSIVLRPFLMLVALSFYWDARDLGGTGAATLAAVIEAEP